MKSRASAYLAVIVFIVATGPVFAQSEAETRRAVELALSEETLQLRYDTPTDFGGAGNRASYALFLSEDRDVVGSVGLLLNTELPLGPVSVRFGPQAYGALLDEENQDVFSLTLGLEARYDLVKSSGIAIVGRAYYGPDVLTFGSADNLQDYMARGEMRLNPNLLIFGGYRWFKFDLLDLGETELQNELFVGVRWQLK